MIRRFLQRHVDAALAWEQHVTDALDLFDFADDTSEPLEPWVPFSLTDALFLHGTGIDTS